MNKWSVRIRARMSMRALVVMALGVLPAQPALAAGTYLNGRISNITTTGGSLMVMLDTGVPDNCAGTPYGWIVIPQEYKVMTAFVLALYFSGNMDSAPVTIYTDGLVSGYCRANQLDP